VIGLHLAGADQREAAPQPPTSASLVFLSRNGLKRDRSAPGRRRPTGGGTTASSHSGGRSGPIALTHKSCYRAGFITGEQVTPGAPWRIRMTEELKSRFVEEAPAEYLPMLEATIKLGVSRQTVLQRVKRGELEALHIGGGRRKGLRIKVIDDQPDLFGRIS